MTNKINGIDLSKYFKNHYDSWGRLYCIEYKGSPLELQNDIKRLQEENEGLKTYIQKMDKPEIKTIDSEIALKNIELQKENEKLKADLKGETEQCQKWYQLETDKHFQMLKYKQALEEIREIAKYSVMHNSELNVNYQIILQKIDEALYDRD